MILALMEDKIVAVESAVEAVAAVVGIEVEHVAVWVDPLVMEMAEDDSWVKVVEGGP